MAYEGPDPSLLIGSPEADINPGRWGVDRLGQPIHWPTAQPDRTTEIARPEPPPGPVSDEVGGRAGVDPVGGRPVRGTP
jgi:hypothetical protein